MAIELSGKREKRIFSAGRTVGRAAAKAKAGAGQTKDAAIMVAGGDIGQRFFKGSKIPKTQTPTQYGVAIAAIAAPMVGINVSSDLRKFALGMAVGQRAVEVNASTDAKNVLPW